jgi:hypothetical protein
MSFNEMSLDEIVVVLEQAKKSGDISDELIYSFDVTQNVFEIMKSIARGYSLIEIITDDNENLTFDGFCYQHNIDKQYIEDLIKNLESISPIYGTKTTFKKLSKKINELFSTFVFIFWKIINRGEIDRFWTDIFKVEFEEVESAFNSFNENCARRFKFN